MVERNSSGNRACAAEDRIDLVDPDPRWAQQYEKEAAEELAACYPTDREAYTDGKTAFVAVALAI